jgi:hypothetical protein
MNGAVYTLHYLPSWLAQGLNFALNVRYLTENCNKQKQERKILQNIMNRIYILWCTVKIIRTQHFRKSTVLNVAKNGFIKSWHNKY